MTIRIPNLPLGPIVDKNGNPTAEELTFREALLGLLQTNFGPEGCVVPTQTAANITTIQNNTNSQGAYTCQFGTFLYDSTNNVVKFTINDGSGAPVFKTVTFS